jgi:hypothetical protein
MKMLLALLLSALISGSALAFPIGGSSLTSCPNPNNVAGATILPNTNCTLVNAVGTWSFGSVCTGSDYNILLGGSSFSGNCGAALELCAGSGSQYNPYLSWRETIDGSLIYLNYVNFQHTIQGTALCGALAGSFQNVTTSTNYDTAVDALSNAANGNTLHFPAMPGGVPFWFDAGTLAANNLTVNVDAGAIFDRMGSPSPPSQAQFVVAGNTNVLNGGKYQNAGSGNDAIKIDSLALNTTLKNLTATGSQSTCILAGGQNGASNVIQDVVVFNCGLENGVTGGQDHNVYLGGETSGSQTGWTITGIDSYDVTGGTGGGGGNGGWTLKLRAPNTTLTGDAAHYYVGCQKGTQPQCEQNGAIDYPCGGAHSVSHMVIEVGPGGDNWYLTRQGEETPQAGGPAGACPNIGTYADTLTIDASILIWDNHLASGNPGYIPIICGGDAACILASSFTSCVKNSIIISDPLAPQPMSLGPNVTDCGAGGNSNTFYASRAAACTGQGWSGLGADKFGNANVNCAFPWVPPKP